MHTRLLWIWIVGLALSCATEPRLAAAQSAKPAAEKPGLFVNLTSDDTWRGWMALHFAWRTQQQGHPTTVFLNLDAVRWAWSKFPHKTLDNIGTPPQTALTNLLKDGGTVLICGPCIDRLGIPAKDLIPGVKMGAPGLTQSLMFKEGTRIISW
jgi:sulfur relay (sulfurtransferase) complex TusBCD TusD component (DsrE family)